VNTDMRLKSFYEIPAGSLGEEWNRLVWTMDSPQVFYTHEWALAVSRAYANPRPLLFTAYRGESLVGVAALALDERRKEASFLCTSTADYCDFVSAPSDREELISRVLRELRERDIKTFRFANLPADSASTNVLRAAAKSAGFSALQTPAYFCARISLDSPEQRLQIAQSARRSLKKARKMAARAGGVAIAHRKTWQEFVTEADDYATASVARMLTTGRASNLLYGERRVFMAELAKLLSARGWLTFSTLGIEGRTVAWHFGFQFAGTWFYYAPTFDADLLQLHPRPGAHLLREILQAAASDPETRTVDLGLGDESYKRPYSSNGRHTVDIVASQSRLRILKERARYQVAQTIKRSPSLENRTRSLVSKISAIHGTLAPLGMVRSAKLLCASAWRHVSRTEEFFFLEADRAKIENAPATSAKPLTLKFLAKAAMKNPADCETLKYVQRSANRLQQARHLGFVLADKQDAPVHICWVAPFEGFRLPGMKHGLKEPSPDSVMLFDPWTCHQPGRNAEFSAMIAWQLYKIGKRPWICAGGSQVESLEAEGFVCRFSLARKNKLSLKNSSLVELANATRQVELGPAA